MNVKDIYLTWDKEGEWTVAIGNPPAEFRMYHWRTGLQVATLSLIVQRDVVLGKCRVRPTIASWGTGWIAEYDPPTPLLSRDRLSKIFDASQYFERSPQWVFNAAIDSFIEDYEYASFESAIEELRCKPEGREADETEKLASYHSPE